MGHRVAEAGRDSSLRKVFAEVISHARGPLGRGALFLTANQFIVSSFGFLFWIAAARTFAPAAVGHATSLIAGGVFLGILATLGLPYALVRRMPRSQRPARLVALVLAATAGAGLAVGAAGGAALALASPDLSFLIAQPLDLLLFSAFVCAFATEVVLEQVLVAARRSEWSTVMLTLFSVLRLSGPLLLPGGGARELLLFWLLAMAAAVGLTVAVLVPRAVASLEPRADGDPPALRPLLGDAALNHAATLFALVGPALLPATLLVTQGGLPGASASATFYIAYQVASLLFTVSVALALVQFAEGARAEVDSHENERRALRLGALAVVPAAVVVAIAAPLILSFFGPSYVSEGTALLQVLAAAAVAAIPATVLASRYRLAGDMRPPMVASVLSSAVALLGAVVAVPAIGIVGAGVALLVGQVAAAFVLAASPRPAKRGGDPAGV